MGYCPKEPMWEFVEDGWRIGDVLSVLQRSLACSSLLSGAVPLVNMRRSTSGLVDPRVEVKGKS